MRKRKYVSVSNSKGRKKSNVKSDEKAIVRVRSRIIEALDLDEA